MSLAQLGGKDCLVLGLGSAGLAAVQALARSGARVRARDDHPAACAAARTLGIFAQQPRPEDLENIAFLLLTPGIAGAGAQQHPLAAQAKARSVPIISDLELLAKATSPARRVGITGTNGKSTTTSLLAHLLSTAGVNCAQGGNLGPAVCALADLPEQGVYVIEASSYQLEHCQSLRFDLALWLNLSPDHLERHGDLASYRQAKEKIFANQTAADQAIIGIDDAASLDLYLRLEKQGGRALLPVSVADLKSPDWAPAPAAEWLRLRHQGLRVDDGRLYDARLSECAPILDVRGLSRLKGGHNAQNVAIAYAAARRLCVPASVIRAGLESFAGLAHRQEWIAEASGIAFINDSKATNPHAAARALSCFGDIYWILGGRAKPENWTPGSPDPFAQDLWTACAPWAPRIAAAFVIGEAQARICHSAPPTLACEPCTDLSDALTKAFACAQKQKRPQPTILFSPACSSFDQFSDFAARGEAFRAIVHEFTHHQRRKEGK